MYPIHTEPIQSHQSPFAPFPLPSGMFLCVSHQQAFCSSISLTLQKYSVTNSEAQPIPTQNFHIGLRIYDIVLCQKVAQSILPSISLSKCLLYALYLDSTRNNKHSEEEVVTTSIVKSSKIPHPEQVSIAVPFFATANRFLFSMLQSINLLDAGAYSSLLILNFSGH